MQKTIKCLKTGHPGKEMIHVWKHHEGKFDDGIDDIAVPQGSKVPTHSEYYMKLFAKHHRKDGKKICTDCGKPFRGNFRCEKCEVKYRKEQDTRKGYHD